MDNKVLLAKTILGLPEKYLEVSDNGRIDFPRNLKICGICSSTSCLYRALYNRKCRCVNLGLETRIVRACKDEAVPRLSQKTFYIVSCNNIDELSWDDYLDYALPVILEQYRNEK